MPLPVASGLGAWFVGLVGLTASRAFTWFMAFFTYRTSVGLARAVAFILVAASMLVTLSLAMKAAILGVQQSMPQSLGQFTYFLPANLNQIFAVAVTLRVSVFLYRWTVRNVRIVTQQTYL